MRRQLDQTALYARQHGLDLDESLSLSDIGLSAYDGANITKGELGRFLEAVRQGRIERGSFLIVESLDRLSRLEPLAALGQFIDILNAEITIVSLAEGKEYRPGDINASDLLVTIGFMARAFDESAMKSKRVKGAWEQKKMRASVEKLTRQCPRWLWLDVSKGQFTIIGERARTVQRIYELALGGLGADAITRRLNKERVPSFGKACTTGSERSSGSGWQKSSVLKILRFRAVLGEYQPHEKVSGKRTPVGPPVTNYYPPIIDEKTFYSVQSAIERRRVIGGGRKGAFVSNLFTKIAKCGYCWSAMHHINKGQKGGRSLICDKARRGLGCFPVPWKYDNFEEACLSFIGELDLGSLSTVPAEMDACGKLESLAREIDGRLVDAQRERERIFQIYIEPKSSLYIREKFAEVERRVSALEEKRNAVAQELSQLDHTKQAYQKSRENIQAVIERLRNRSDEEVALLRASAAARISDVVQEIIVYPAGYLQTPNDKRALKSRMRHWAKVESDGKDAIEDGRSQDMAVLDVWAQSGDEPIVPVDGVWDDDGSLTSLPQVSSLVSVSDRLDKETERRVLMSWDARVVKACFDHHLAGVHRRAKRGFFIWFRDGSHRFVSPKWQ